MDKKKKITAFDIYNPYELSWGEEVLFPSSRNVREYGNRIYNRYPARSIFLVPRAILSHQENNNLRVLDPFMGSGTTAVETVLSGYLPLGLEMDPFARMVAEVSAKVFKREQLHQIEEQYLCIKRTWKSYKESETPHLFGIERWFKPGDLSLLLRLKTAIQAIASPEYANFFMVTFADAIKPVSLMERQSIKPYISSRYVKETKEVETSFDYSFNAHFSAEKEMNATKQYNKNIEWLGTDATDFSTDEGYVDIAISSPPYINALDYTRCIKVESAMCGTIDDEIASRLRGKQVGHERRKSQQISPMVEKIFKTYYNEIEKVDLERANTCRAYFNDIAKNLICVRNTLKRAGEYHVIIGDNTIRNIFVPTHTIIASIAKEVGFDWFGYYKYQIKDHRTSVPRNNKMSKIDYEHVLMLRKV